MKSTNVNGNETHCLCVAVSFPANVIKNYGHSASAPAIMSPGSRRQQYPRLCRSILRCLLSSVLRGLPPSACDTRRPQLLAVRRLLPFLLRGLMPSACGTRCQPVACDCRPPVTRGARFCLLSSVLCPPLGVPVVRPLPAVPVSARCPARYAVFRSPVDAPPSEKKAAPDRDGSARVQYARSLISWRLSCPLRRAR